MPEYDLLDGKVACSSSVLSTEAALIDANIVIDNTLGIFNPSNVRVEKDMKFFR